MNVNERMERLYESVELVRGAGDRRKRRLCIMSFVALLAGEEHTDDPKTASRVIRRYGIVVNDEMPADLRQRLKPFAPRILGTRDRHDRERARLLLEAWQTEILPRLAADFGQTVGAADEATRLLLSSNIAPVEATACKAIASSVARLISHFAATVAPPKREWYWLKAIELLDRLCDVSEAPQVSLHADLVSGVEVALGGKSRTESRPGLAGTALARLRRLIPTLAS